jgi:hypothetical protein
MLAALQSFEYLNSLAPLGLLAMAASFLGLLRDHTVVHEVPARTTCACGYDFAGLPDTGTCPECGESFDQRTPREVSEEHVWLSRRGIPTVAFAMTLWVGLIALSWPIARGVLTMMYLADGFSWETSLRAPLVRELESSYAWEALALWATIAACTPILARCESRRKAIIRVLWAHAFAVGLNVVVPLTVSLVRIATR